MKNQIERAEPSRGAPNVEQFWLKYNDCDGELIHQTDNQNAFKFAEAYAKSGHVVLLEALRRLTEDFFPKTCKHNGEPWYCDSCRFEWEKEFALRKVLARAAIKQAERT